MSKPSESDKMPDAPLHVDIPDTDSDRASDSGVANDDTVSDASISCPEHISETSWSDVEVEEPVVESFEPKLPEVFGEKRNYKKGVNVAKMTTDERKHYNKVMRQKSRARAKEAKEQEKKENQVQLGVLGKRNRERSSDVATKVYIYIYTYTNLSTYIRCVRTHI